jgi:hypothetical protein
MTNKRVLLSFVAILAIAAAVLLGGSSNTAVAKKAPPVSFEFSVTFAPEPEAGETFPTADEITTAVLRAGKIGSRGSDGTGSDFQIDSFFDVEYRLFGDPDFLFGDPDFLTIDIELVALSLTGANPIPVIDNVGDVLGKYPSMTEYRGHVTVLK